MMNIFIAYQARFNPLPRPVNVPFSFCLQGTHHVFCCDATSYYIDPPAARWLTGGMGIEQDDE